MNLNKVTWEIYSGDTQECAQINQFLDAIESKIRFTQDILLEYDDSEITGLWNIGYKGIMRKITLY